jgi:hypothetical protein
MLNSCQQIIEEFIHRHSFRIDGLAQNGKAFSPSPLGHISQWRLALAFLGHSLSLD